MNKTTNYQLNQWVKSDQVRMEDFNADNAKLDAAIKAVDQKADGLSEGKADVSALEALDSRTRRLEYEMEIRGYAMTYTYSYIGRGSPTVTLPFNHRPELVFLMAKDGSLPVVIAAYGAEATNSADVTFHSWPTSGGLTGFTGPKYNESGKRYIAVGILNCIY